MGEYMQNDWPTQDKDLEAAVDIIHRYTDVHGGDPLEFMDTMLESMDLDTNFDFDDNTLTLETPPWILELYQHFADAYGYEYGHTIASRVITRLLLAGETIH
jgi:hypothetical protein